MLINDTKGAYWSPWCINQVWCLNAATNLSIIVEEEEEVWLSVGAMVGEPAELVDKTFRDWSSLGSMNLQYLIHEWYHD